MRTYKKYLTAILITTTAFLVMTGCDKKKPETDSASPIVMGEKESGGGLTWNVPVDWTVGQEKAMRLATYIIKPAGDDTDSAECAVFYFGPEHGGEVDLNLQRWAGQFEQPDGGNSLDKAEIESEKRDDLKITTIDLTGTYLVTGAMMQVTGKKDNYRLLGAIVEGPQGLVFFKMTGPQNTMESAATGFYALLKSIKPALT
ncbi:MAG: hypothetical protein JSW64_05910 [Candidatus Zixiibacteriota bacterium]|nr:MAG: hypothetical protein JSW64_05910 [candidate division Zixibacteria bacterium]